MTTNGAHVSFVLDLVVRDLQGRVLAQAGAEPSAFTSEQLAQVRTGLRMVQPNPEWSVASPVRDPKTGAVIGTKPFATDECPRPSTADGLAGLTVNRKGTLDGLHTAGNSSQIADGAVAGTPEAVRVRGDHASDGRLVGVRCARRSIEVRPLDEGVGVFEPIPPYPPRTEREAEFYTLGDGEMFINMGPQHPSTHGVLRLKLYPLKYSFQFLPASGGASLDSGGRTCR